MFVTRRPRGAKPQAEGPQGLVCRSNAMASRPDFELVQAKTWQLHSHVSLEEDPMPKGRWKPGGVVGRPCGCPSGRPSPPN
jgi:hypothetical protein